MPRVFVMRRNRSSVGGGRLVATSPQAPTDRPPRLWRRLVVRPQPEPTNLPKWLVGDWNPVIRDPLDLLRLVPLIGGIVSVIVGGAHTVELLGGFWSSLCRGF